MARRTAAAQKRREPFEEALQEIGRHPVFASLTVGAHLVRRDMDGGTLAVTHGDGSVWVDSRRLLSREEWMWVFGHALLHLGLDDPHPEGIPSPQARDAAAAVACLEVERLLVALKIGRRVDGALPPLPPERGEVLRERWRREGVPALLTGLGTNPNGPDFLGPASSRFAPRLASGLSRAVTEAVEVAGGMRTSSGELVRRQPWDAALRWFVSSFPLLGALAAGMTVVADVDLAREWDIAVAAVSESAGEIYVNPFARLTHDEWCFVVAHEMLHAALHHGRRVAHRDPYLWNVATDFVINGWLVEMAVGAMPSGLLHDPLLAGLSAEEVYDRLASDLRRSRKLATLRGRGQGDVLDRPLREAGEQVGAVDLDEFYRRALTTGLEWVRSNGRGFVPAGLVQEIQALDVPPPPWDVRLARWFEEFVPAVQPIRSYARASRRQASSPDIPRAGRHWPDELDRTSTFGVVLDTSWSMDRRLLAKGLGAIASYAVARGVRHVRVVFCDAAPYDAGWLAPEEIAGRVAVRGRGGTVLQPGIDLLERAADFPADGPVLVITDGECDVLRVRREHAYLVPVGAWLPFRAAGPVFVVE